MTQRFHTMSFSAELLEDGRVHFRLCAPSADEVELCQKGLSPPWSLVVLTTEGDENSTNI